MSMVAAESSLLITIVGLALSVFCIGLVLRCFNQPYVIAYIVVGIVLGPHGFNLISDKATLSQVGELGILLLLFFIGMHVSLPRLISNWKIPILGTLFQISASVGLVWWLSQGLGWPLERAVLLGFVISLSSTAVVLKVLEDWDELKTKVGQNVLGILLVQDLAFIPMLIILGLLGGQGIQATVIIGQLVGGLLMFGILLWLLSGRNIPLPFASSVRNDHEMQVFVALILCFGFALITAMFGLSPALGAFVAGIVVAASPDIQWIQSRLEPFHVLFVALFFIYIGLLIDLNFVFQHWVALLILVVGIFVLNTCINALVLWFLGDNWRESLYAGTLLSQIGEFSFLLAAVGLSTQVISSESYQLVISVISLSLLLSPIWITLTKRLLHIDAEYVFERMVQGIHKGITLGMSNKRKR